MIIALLTRVFFQAHEGRFRYIGGRQYVYSDEIDRTQLTTDGTRDTGIQNSRSRGFGTKVCPAR